jgi:hypothetical protein
MLTPNTAPDYKAFARDLMRLCKKHGVQITASDEGFVGIGPANLKTVGEYLYSELEFTPTTAKLAGGWEGKEPKPITVKGIPQ